MLTGTIAHRFFEQTSQDLWETLAWLNEQPASAVNRRLARRIGRELNGRQARRQALAETWD